MFTQKFWGLTYIESSARQWSKANLIHDFDTVLIKAKNTIGCNATEYQRSYNLCQVYEIDKTANYLLIRHDRQIICHFTNQPICKRTYWFLLFPQLHEVIMQIGISADQLSYSTLFGVLETVFKFMIFCTVFLR